MSVTVERRAPHPAIPVRFQSANGFAAQAVASGQSRQVGCGQSGRGGWHAEIAEEGRDQTVVIMHIRHRLRDESQQ